MKSAIPPRKSRRCPKRSPSRPPSSRKPPKVSRYAFTTHASDVVREAEVLLDRRERDADDRRRRARSSGRPGRGRRARASGCGCPWSSVIPSEFAVREVRRGGGPGFIGEATMNSPRRGGQCSNGRRSTEHRRVRDPRPHRPGRSSRPMRSSVRAVPAERADRRALRRGRNRPGRRDRRRSRAAPARRAALRLPGPAPQGVRRAAASSSRSWGSGRPAVRAVATTRAEQAGRRAGTPLGVEEEREADDPRRPSISSTCSAHGS